MSYLDALIYGFVQGVTEYLPISSSAHLILVPQFLGQADPGLTFDVFLHVGTVLSTFIYFWRDWVGVLSTVPGAGRVIPPPIMSRANFTGLNIVNYKLIICATVPALVAGALMRPFSGDLLRGNQILVVTLVVGGILLVASDFFCKQSRTLKTLGLKDALWIGVAQCFALIPGMSRSGATITGGRILGFDRASAARFSFLMSGPVTLAAVVFELRHWSELVSGSGVGSGPLIVGCVSSFMAGWMAIGGLLSLVRRFSFMSFALYRVCLAIVIYRVLGF